VPFLHGVPDPLLVEPEAYWLDTALLQRPGNVEIQLDLFLDYANNVKLYLSFQEYFRKYQPPLLATWGKNDPFFIPPGAEAYRRDIPSAKVVFYDTGHFALETQVEEISGQIHSFLTGLVKEGRF
jgi:pimeloyl-ACP methyl ester carboxylesterase